MQNDLAVAKEKILELEEFEIAATQKRKIAMQAAEAIVDETSFNGFGNETWKAMWQAARSGTSRMRRGLA